MPAFLTTVREAILGPHRERARTSEWPGPQRQINEPRTAPFSILSPAMESLLDPQLLQSDSRKHFRTTLRLAADGSGQSGFPASQIPFHPSLLPQPRQTKPLSEALHRPSLDAFQPSQNRDHACLHPHPDDRYPHQPPRLAKLARQAPAPQKEYTPEPSPNWKSTAEPSPRCNYPLRPSLTRENPSQPSPKGQYPSQPSPLREYTPQPSPVREYTPQPSPFREYTPQPSPKRQHPFQPSPKRQYPSEPSQLRDYPSQPSPCREHTPQPSPTRRYASQPSQRRDFAAQPSPLRRDFSPRLSRTRERLTARPLRPSLEVAPTRRLASAAESPRKNNTAPTRGEAPIPSGSEEARRAQIGGEAQKETMAVLEKILSVVKLLSQETAKVKEELLKDKDIAKMVEDGAQTEAPRMEEIDFAVEDEGRSSMAYTASNQSVEEVEEQPPTIWNLAKRQKLSSQSRKSLPV